MNYVDWRLWRCLFDTPFMTKQCTKDKPLGICAGKHSIAEYLVQHHHFLRLHLPSLPPIPLTNPEKDDFDPADAKRLLPSVTDEKGTRGLSFPDVESLLDFVTKRWREHWVLTDIWDDATLDTLLRRPFFMLISVDGPITQRFQRFSDRCGRRSLSPPPLAKFVLWSDTQLYSSSPPRSHGTAYLSSRAHLHILNNFQTISALHSALSSLDIVSPSRLRPTWYAYFMTLASLTARRSNCMKRRVGCVLVYNSRIIATGYNGTPRNLTNCNEGGCARCNGGTGAGAALSTCLCLHAEENALLEAGRERIRVGSILYCDTCPCLTCAVKITQVGISEVVFSQGYNMDGETRAVFEEGGVKLRRYSPPTSGLINLGLQLEAAEGEEEGQRSGNGLEKAVIVRGRY